MRVIPTYDHATVDHRVAPAEIIELILMEANDTATSMGWAVAVGWCEKCPGLREIKEMGSNSGFAGEGLYWTTYGCGHQEMEEGEYTDY